MRNILPTDEYRLVKNRLSARMCRRKRKQERVNDSVTLRQT